MLHFEQGFATKPLKHLLKNGIGSTPELEDDITEKLLNSLARQQKQSTLTETSSPPIKRQKLLGVNKNNEIIVVDDQTSGLSPNKKPLPPVRSRQLKGSPGKAGTSCSPQAVAPANGCVTDISVQPKAMSAESHKQRCSKAVSAEPSDEQRCNNTADVATEIICIDDDDDDDDCAAVCANILSTNLCSRGKTSGNESAACISVDDATDNEQLPSTSEQVSGSCLSTLSSGVDVQQQISPLSSPASTDRSSKSEKIARLEKLLEVSLFL